jgi:hypothetical protein
MAASTLSDFTKLVLPATLLAGTVFSVLTAPLVMYGSEQIVVRFQDERIFDDRLKDIAAPYIGFAGLVSLSAGAASLGITGWRQAARRSHTSDGQIAALHQELQAKATQVEELLLSETRLEALGLGVFLQDDAPLVQTQPIPPQPVAQARPQPVTKSQPAMAKQTPGIVVQTSAPVIDALIFGADSLVPLHSRYAANRQVQSVVSPLAAAQVVLGLSRATTQAVLPVPQPPQDHAAQVLVVNGHVPVAESV